MANKKKTKKKKKTSKKKLGGSIYMVDESAPMVNDASTFEFTPKPAMVALSELELDDQHAKIVVVVAESVLDGKIRLECGRAAAQAAHAVSKLKLSYADYQATNEEHIASVVSRLTETPITTIVLKARDEKELTHIEAQAKANDLHAVPFYDDNKALYGEGNYVFTALAIGPIDDWQLDGVTDYLPLWDCHH